MRKSVKPPTFQLVMALYEYLEHPADLKIRAYGDTKPALFKNALQAMSNFLLGGNLTSHIPDSKFLPRARSKGQIPNSDQQQVTREISLSSSGIETLLVDFLSECLTFSDTNEEVYTDVEFEKFSDKSLKGKLFGFKIEKRAHDIKAVTYHDLEIKKNPDGFWQATVLCDI